MKKIIRELQADWPDYLSATFNPLPDAYSLKTESPKAPAIRNIYHKLLPFMQEIVDKHHQNFTDSLELFTQIYTKYSQNQQLLLQNQKLATAVDSRRNEQPDLTIHKQIAEIEQKLMLLQRIQHIAETLRMGQSGHLLQPAELGAYVSFYAESSIFMDSMDNFYALHELHESLKSFGSFLFRRVAEYLLELTFSRDAVANKDLYMAAHLIHRLDSIGELDEFLYKNFKSRLYQNLEAIAMDAGVIEKSIEYLNSVYKRIKKMKRRLLVKNQPNFFEIEKEQKEKIFREKDDIIKELLLHEMKRLVRAFSSEEGFVESGYQVDFIEPNFSFSSLYAKRFQIFQKFQESVDVSGYGEYTVSIPPDDSFLLKYYFYLKKLQMINKSKEHKSNRIDVSNQVKDVGMKSEGMETMERKNEGMKRTKNGNVEVKSDDLLDDMICAVQQMIYEQYKKKDKHFTEKFDHTLSKADSDDLNYRRGSVHYIDRLCRLLKRYQGRIEFLASFNANIFKMMHKIEEDLSSVFPRYVYACINSDFEDFLISMPKQLIEPPKKFRKIWFYVRSLDSLDEIVKNTLFEKEKIQVDPEVAKIRAMMTKTRKMYLYGLRLDNISRVFYFFDKMTREGSFINAGDSHPYLDAIKRIINWSLSNRRLKRVQSHQDELSQLFDCIKISDTPTNLKVVKQESHFEGLFKALNHYLKTSMLNINVRKPHELENYIEVLRRVEEIFYSDDIDDGSFDEVIMILENIINGKTEDEQSQWLYKKINNE